MTGQTSPLFNDWNGHAALQMRFWKHPGTLQCSHPSAQRMTTTQSAPKRQWENEMAIPFQPESVLFIERDKRLVNEKASPGKVTVPRRQLGQQETLQILFCHVELQTTPPPPGGGGTCIAGKLPAINAELNPGMHPRQVSLHRSPPPSKSTVYRQWLHEARGSCACRRTVGLKSAGSFSESNAPLPTVHLVCMDRDRLTAPFTHTSGSCSSHNSAEKPTFLHGSREVQICRRVRLGVHTITKPRAMGCRLGCLKDQTVRFSWHDTTVIEYQLKCFTKISHLMKIKSGWRNSAEYLVLREEEMAACSFHFWAAA